MVPIFPARNEVFELGIEGAYTASSSMVDCLPKDENALSESNDFFSTVLISLFFRDARLDSLAFFPPLRM